MDGQICRRDGAKVFWLVRLERSAQAANAILLLVDKGMTC